MLVGKKERRGPDDKRKNGQETGRARKGKKQEASTIRA